MIYIHSGIPLASALPSCFLLFIFVFFSSGFIDEELANGSWWHRKKIENNIRLKMKKQHGDKKRARSGGGFD